MGARSSKSALKQTQIDNKDKEKGTKKKQVNINAMKQPNKSGLKSTGEWGVIKKPTNLFITTDKEFLQSIKPFKMNKVFSEKKDSVHELSRAGTKKMKIKFPKIAKPNNWSNFFIKIQDPSNKKSKDRDAAKFREFALKLAISNPKEIFDGHLWMDGELQENAVTNPWISAYRIFGAPWTNHETFEEHLNNEKEDPEQVNKENKVEEPSSNNENQKKDNESEEGGRKNNFIHLPLDDTPTADSRLIYMHNRNFISFCKFKTQIIKGNTKYERESFLSEQMEEMLEAVWDRDPLLIMIPWELQSKAKGIKKDSKRRPNSAEGWKIYAERVFIRKGN